jgi:hypothetical protein
VGFITPDRRAGPQRKTERRQMERARPGKRRKSAIGALLMIAGAIIISV